METIQGQVVGGVRAGGARKVKAIGCVGFLNAKPLIDGLEDGVDPVVKFDVPSGLLGDLEAGVVDIALCPVIDYQRSRGRLVIVPVGGIGCAGRTLTVRLFSKVPMHRVKEVHADTDSHTSVVLARVLLGEMYGIRPGVVDFKAGVRGGSRRPLVNDQGLNAEGEHAPFGASLKCKRGGNGPGVAEAGQTAPLRSRLIKREARSGGDELGGPETVLLIGDKVVTDCPSGEVYEHEMDLGQAWWELTGLPFVFAVWMAKGGSELGELPGLLKRQREVNSKKIGEIVARYAGGHGWPVDLAGEYLGKWLRYEVGGKEVEAMERFFGLAKKWGLIEGVRTVVSTAQATVRVRHTQARRRSC